MSLYSIDSDMVKTALSFVAGLTLYLLCSQPAIARGIYVAIIRSYIHIIIYIYASVYVLVIILLSHPPYVCDLV